MVWYVALVAILNLALGYGLAVYLGAGRKTDDRLALESDAVTFPQPHSEQHSEELPSADLEDGIAPTAQSAADPPESEPPCEGGDPATGFATRESIEQRLTDMTIAHADLQPMTVALLEVEQAVHGAETVDDRLLRGVADLVREMLSESQTAGRYSDQQFLLLLPYEDLGHATQRAEQVRQRVAATQFIADGQEINASVTCALAQVSAEHSAASLLEFLEETLEEAKRYGGNRTFMHDGTSPAPVVPPELNVAPQSCAI